jgi:hypothetical protein
MAKGQVLIEAVIGLTLMLLVVLMLQQQLMPAAHNNEAALTAQRHAIWARTADPEVTQTTDDYPSARASGRVLSSLSNLVELDFDTNNLRTSVAADEQTEAADYPMARITDAWSPTRAEQLQSRPALLVLNSLLSNRVVTVVQDGLGWLPIAKELASDSLIFGHVDADVVPERALTQIPYR